MLGLVFRKFVYAIRNPLTVVSKTQEYHDRKNMPGLEEGARVYLEKEGILAHLSSGDAAEFEPHYLDIRRLYEIVRTRKPVSVLEFGVGFSSIALAYALKRNFEDFGIKGHLHTVDADKRWLENTERKLDENLKPYATFHHSAARIHIENNQVFSLFDELPNICPNFIYVDGPNSDSVDGEIRGLNFKHGRAIVAADALLYESSAPNDFCILVDGRWRVANFLKRNLKGKYRFVRKTARKYQFFEHLG